MSSDILLWFDLETTGLDEATGAILEVGWGLTDTQLNWIAPPVSQVVWPEHLNIQQGAAGEVENVIFDLVPVDPYVIEMHRTSGLWSDLLEEGYATDQLALIEAEILALIDQPTGRVTMAGSGVSQFDMRWIAKHMPRLHRNVTYYCIDLGTYERVDSVLRDGVFRKARGSADHRALADIMYSHTLALTWKKAMR